MIKYLQQLLRLRTIKKQLRIKSLSMATQMRSRQALFMSQWPCRGLGRERRRDAAFSLRSLRLLYPSDCGTCRGPWAPPLPWSDFGHVAPHIQASFWSDLRGEAVRGSLDADRPGAAQIPSLLTTDGENQFFQEKNANIISPLWKERGFLQFQNPETRNYSVPEWTPGLLAPLVRLPTEPATKY